MKNVINYYYGINAIDISKVKDKYIFFIDGIKYVFMQCDRRKKEINSLFHICLELKERNLLSNEIIINKYNNLISIYKDMPYVLIKDNGIKKRIDLNDIFYIQNNTVNIFKDKLIMCTNWVNLWQKKIDYYESKMCELQKYNLINVTIDYFIGLGENALVYLSNNNVYAHNMVLSHRRIYNNDSFNFYNPINYIIDSRARDIAEYIKNIFFYDGVSDNTILSFFKYINFSREEYILFIARMLYPTYYFDLIDKIIFFNDDDKILEVIIDKICAYTKLLSKIIKYINFDLKMNIPTIEWLIKI